MAFPLSLLRYRFVNGKMSVCCQRSYEPLLFEWFYGCLSLDRSEDMLQHRSNGKPNVISFFIYLSMKERWRKMDSKEEIKISTWREKKENVWIIERYVYPKEKGRKERLISFLFFASLISIRHFYFAVWIRSVCE